MNSSSLDAFQADSFPSRGFYYLPSDFNFLETLADSLLYFTQKNPLNLSRYTIFFPTQRALRTFQLLLVQRTENTLILPRLFTLNDLVEHSEDFLIAHFKEVDREDFKPFFFPPPLSLLRGRLLCAEALKRIPSLFKHPLSPGILENLSEALLETLGEMASHGVSLKDGDIHIPETYGAHWEKTTFFLRTILEVWPLILKNEDASDPLVFTQNRLKALSDYLLKHTPTNPLIIAGLRGFSPAFKPFLKTLFQGKQSVFLVEAFSKNVLFEDISPSHPAYELSSFLSFLEVPSSSLKVWPFQPRMREKTLEARISLIENVFFTSVNTLNPLPSKPENLSLALKDVSFFEANSLLEEARLISLRMRHVLESPSKTAAFITPDRKLAELVKTELLKWEIVVDDSFGIRFSQTSVGRYFITSLHALLSHESPLPFLSLLTHPLISLEDPQAYGEILETLELYALRGFKPSVGIEFLLSRLTSLKTDQDKVLNERLERALHLLKNFQHISLPFKNLLEKGAPPSILLKEHEVFLNALSTSPDGCSCLWSNPLETEAFPLFQLLVEETKNLPPLKGKAYRLFLKDLFDKSTLQRTQIEHPRLSILGLFESRLLKKDSVILGGLNEGTWPEVIPSNPWIHKHLREALSLPPLETSLGVSIHDFLQAFSNKEVLLTRSKRTSHGLQRSSRILTQLKTFLDFHNTLLPAPPEAFFLKALEEPILPSLPLKAPCVCPPLKSRPSSLSVSSVERLLKDPYGFYAEQILNLCPLKAFEMKPTASDFGSLIHHFIELICEESFLNFHDLHTEFKNTIVYRSLSKAEQLFWLQKFSSILSSFWSLHKRRCQASEFVSLSNEAFLSTNFSSPSIIHPLEIKGRIDRLEESTSAFHVIDYKTGLLPSQEQVETGLSLQLPLLAFLLSNKLSKDPCSSKEILLSYWPLRKREGDTHLVSLKNPDLLLNLVSQRLKEILDFFYNTSNPGSFKAKPCAYSSYAHLARIKEWAGPLEAFSESISED